MTSPPQTTLSYDAPVTSAVARALGAIRPPSGGDGRERQIERQNRKREGERQEWQGQASRWSLCVGVETLLGASGVDVMKLLLLL